MKDPAPLLWGADRFSRQSLSPITLGEPSVTGQVIGRLSGGLGGGISDPRAGAVGAVGLCVLLPRAGPILECDPNAGPGPEMDVSCWFPLIAKPTSPAVGVMVPGLHIRRQSPRGMKQLVLGLTTCEL